MSDTTEIRTAPDAVWSQVYQELWEPLLAKKPKKALAQGMSFQYVMSLYPVGDAAQIHNELLLQLAAKSKFNDWRDSHEFMNHSARLWQRYGLHKADLYNTFKPSSQWRTTREHRLRDVSGAIGVEHLTTFEGTYRCYARAMVTLAHGMTLADQASLTEKQEAVLARLGQFWHDALTWRP